MKTAKSEGSFWKLQLGSYPQTWNKTRQTGAAVSANHLFLANVNGYLLQDILVTGKIPGSCVCVTEGCSWETAVSTICCTLFHFDSQYTFFACFLAIVPFK